MVRLSLNSIRLSISSGVGGSGGRRDRVKRILPITASPRRHCRRRCRRHLSSSAGRDAETMDDVSVVTRADDAWLAADDRWSAAMTRPPVSGRSGDLSGQAAAVVSVLVRLDDLTVILDRIIISPRRCE